MNKKFLTLFAVFIVAVSMASVCAVELTKENDFNGIFKMKVTDGDNFTSMDDSQSYSKLLQSAAAYNNSNNTVFVFVYKGNINDALLGMTNGDIDPQYGVKNANYTTDGDLTLINKTPKMENLLKDYSINTFAGKSDNKTTVFVGGDNATLVKEYAKTIVFS
ncbi:MAG: hypothetical protein ABS871_03675 [Methanobrevibacter sp.]